MGRVPGCRSIAAGIVAVTDVVELNTVGTGVPASVAVVPAKNPVPAKVNVAEGLPAGTRVLETLVTVGTGLVTMKEAAAVPPPGDGFETRMFIVPGPLSNADGIFTDADVADVTTPVKPPSETDVCPGRNPDPVTVTVVSPLPADALEGTTLASCGTGRAGAVTVKTIAPLVLHLVVDW